MIDNKYTREYIDGLTEKELKHMREAYSLAGLKKMVKIIIREYGREAPTWIFIGRRKDHIVIPKTYCSCRDFTIRVMTRKQHASCKHLVVQWIAEKTNRYRLLVIGLSDYRRIIREILEIGISPTIRKLLYTSQS